MSRSRAESSRLFERAADVIPGGVNSPVRAFRAVGGKPPFVVRGGGAHIVDADGNDYVDYVGSWGPLLFGHAPEFILDALRRAVTDGTSFGAPTEREIRMAELVRRFVPSMEMVRFVSSGSEATSAAVRLARGATGRTKIVKCAGCYHGSVDSLLVTAGSGVATLGIPETAGVPHSLAAETIVVDYNSIEQLDAAFERHGAEIAAFIVEPIAGNMGLVLPRDGYLARARQLTSRAGALLIFDEVITGFRVAAGGAQALYGIVPDLTCLGKIIGGGLPVGAYGGRRDLMKHLAPLGPVYQAGTLSGNPLAMAAGIAALERIVQEGDALYRELDRKTDCLTQAIHQQFDEAGIAVEIPRCGSLFTVFFSEEPVTDYPSARKCNTQRFAEWFLAMLDRGVYLAPSQFECAFVSTAHAEADIDATVLAAREAARIISAC